MSPVGRAAVVTGAADGIGAAIATALARHFSLVIINYRTQGRAADELVGRIRSEGGHALAVRADVADESGVATLFGAIDEATERDGASLGLLVNNAGSTGGFAAINQIEGHQLDIAFRNCLRTTVLCTREAAKRMAPGSVVINISSTAARTSGAGEWVHYAALKAAVNTYTRGAALELAARGIRVNAVAPGLVVSPLHANNGDAARAERLASSVPMGRAGQPEEIADAVVFLSSPQSSYITGHILEVSGGR